MSTRNGKIARLPRWIRNRLNQRLDNGEEGKKLVGWLNRMPEVRAVMAESFEGKPVTEQNLSEWKAGGFAEWVQRQEFLEQARELAKDAEDLRSVAGKGQSSFSEHLSTVLAMRYAGVLKEWKGEASEEMTKQLRLLHGLSHNVARLARVGLERQKVELTREKSQAELVDLFSEWMEIPAVREVYEEEVQGPRSKVQSLKSTGRKRKRQRNKCQGNRGKAKNGKHSTAEPQLGNNIRQLMSNGQGKGRKPSSAGHPSPSIPLPSEGRGKTCRGNFTSEPLRTKSGRKRWLKDPTTCDALGRDLPEVKAAAQKQQAEKMAGWYIPKRPDCEKKGQKNAVAIANPAQSDPVVPPAMEAELARLNAGGDNLSHGNGSQGNYKRDEPDWREATDRPDWDEEDEMIVKQAEEARKRREAARKEAEQKRIDEENRIWRVQCHFEEPTEEDITRGRVGMSKVQSP